MLDVPAISKEAQEKLAAAQDAMDREFNQDPEVKAILEADARARYKIEVMFGPRRTVNGPNVCLVQLWESGKHLNGGGDSVLYLCLNHTKLHMATTRDVLFGLKKNPDAFEWVGGCGQLVPDRQLQAGIGYCAHCRRGINAELAAHLLPFECTTTHLAEVLALLFRQLDHSADIYSKFFPDDIRYQATLRAYGPEKGRKLRGLAIYPLQNILKDTANGSSLEARFRAYLTA